MEGPTLDFGTAQTQRMECANIESIRLLALLLACVHIIYFLIARLSTWPMEGPTSDFGTAQTLRTECAKL